MGKQQEYKFHPVADAYPLFADDEADALASDIAENGLKEDIVLFDGQILDGRNRYRACLKAGVEPRFTEYDGDATAGGIIAYVRSMNDFRRHLNSSQNAAVARLLSEWLKEQLVDEAKDRQRAAGGDKKSSKAKESLRQRIDEAIEDTDENEGRAAQQLAKLHDTNRQYIADVWKFDLETVCKIRDGSLTVPQAKAEFKKTEQATNRRSQNRRVKVAAPSELKAMTYRLVIIGLEWIREFGANWPASMGDDKPLAGALDEDCLLFFRTGGDAEIGFRAGNVIDHWSCRRARRYFALLGTEKFNGETWENIIVGYRGKVPVEDIVPRSPVKCSKEGIEPALLAAAMPWLKDAHSDKRVLHFAGKLVLPGAVNWPLKGEVIAA